MFGPFKKKTDEEKKEQELHSSESGNSQETLYEEVTEEKVEHAVENHDACQSELTSVKDQLVRIGADFQNFKKRTERDRTLWAQAVTADIFLGLLPVVDNFERALDQAKKTNNPELNEWIAGFELIYKSLYDFLKKNRVETIEQVTIFDPNLHEALMQVEDPEKESGTIIQVFEKGYVLEGKVLRPAKVSVAR